MPQDSSKPPSDSSRQLQWRPGLLVTPRCDHLCWVHNLWGVAVLEAPGIFGEMGQSLVPALWTSNVENLMKSGHWFSSQRLPYSKQIWLSPTMTSKVNMTDKVYLQLASLGVHYIWQVKTTSGKWSHLWLWTCWAGVQFRSISGRPMLPSYPGQPGHATLPSAPLWRARTALSPDSSVGFFFCRLRDSLPSAWGSDHGFPAEKKKQQHASSNFQVKLRKPIQTFATASGWYNWLIQSQDSTQDSLRTQRLIHAYAKLSKAQSHPEASRWYATMLPCESSETSFYHIPLVLRM